MTNETKGFFAPMKPQMRVGACNQSAKVAEEAVEAIQAYSQETPESFYEECCDVLCAAEGLRQSVIEEIGEERFLFYVEKVNNKNRRRGYTL